jgi:hypothetical protein
VVGQLAFERRFDYVLADLAHEGVKVIQGLNALLLEEPLEFFPVKSQIEPP